MAETAILVLTDVASAFGGNCAETLRALEEKAQAKNVNIIFAFPREAQNALWTKQYGHHEYFEWRIASIREMIKRIEKKYRIALIHYNYVSVKHSVIFRLSLKRAMPVVFHFRNHLREYRGNKQRVLMLAYRYLYGFGEKIVISEGVQSSIESNVNSTGIHRIPNGIALERFQNIQRMENEIPCFMIMGNHYYRKGVDIAIRGLSELGFRNKLMIVASREEEVRKFISSLNIDAGDCEVSIVPTIQDVKRYYEIADVFLAPSREEGLNNSIVEATYCGCEVVATRISGQSEIDLGSIRWICDPVNSEDAASELREAAAQLIRRRRDAQESREAQAEIRKQIEARYSMDVCASSIFDVYEHLCARQ